MASHKNKVEIEGNLLADPEYKTFDSGSRVANLRVASDQFYGKHEGPEGKAEWNKATAYVSVEAWNEEADKASKLKKGDLVSVKGKIQTKSWEHEGKKSYMTYIRGTEVNRLERERKTEQEQGR